MRRIAYIRRKEIAQSRILERGDKLVEDIRPLKGPVEIKEAFPITPFILLVLLLLVAAVIILYFRKRKKKEEEKSLPPRPPWEIALVELEALQKMGLIERASIKEYYIRLSDIIRKYIESSFKIPALETTTWELYQNMKAKKIERDFIERLRDFLEECDLVKFAKYVPDKKDIEEMYSSAREIVETSMPKETINIKG